MSGPDRDDAPPLETGERPTHDSQADTAAHAAFADFWRTLEPALRTPLAEALTAARKQHRRILEDHGLAGACPTDAADARERLAGYVTATADDVHGPLAEAWAGAEPVMATTARYEAAVTELRRALEDLPRRLEVDGDPTRAEDRPGVATRFGGSLSRVLLALRPSRRHRTVDVQAVARRHVHDHVHVGWAELYQDALRGWGRWSAAVEAAWVEWIEDVLEAGTEPEAVEDGGEPPDEAWDVAAGAAAALDAALRDIEGFDPVGVVVAEAERALPGWRAALSGDIGRAGIPPFPARPDPPPWPEPAPPGPWAAWGEQTVDRFALHASLLAVFDAVRTLRLLVPARLRADALGELEPTARDAAAALDALAERAGNADDLAKALPGLSEEAERILERIQGVRPVAPAFEEAAERASDAGVARLQNTLRSMPAEVVLHRLTDRPRELRSPPGDPRTIRLQDMARQSFDALRIERIRKAPGRLPPVAQRVAVALDEVAEVVRYGFSSGEQELEDAGGSDTARTLVTDGLTRAAEALRTVHEPVDDAVSDVREALGLELAAGCERLVERALARRVRGHLMDAQSTLGRRASDAWRRLGPGLRRAGRMSGVGLALLRRQAARFVRRGRTLVGADAAPDFSASRTARSLATADAMMHGLPLVYQRLFSSEPVSDDALLVGRDTALADAEARWRRWHDEDGVPVIVTGAHGTGMSSFLRVLAEQMKERGARAVYHALDRRYAVESELAAHLSGLVGLEPAATLDELAARILRAPSDAVPDLVALDELEHLYLRVSSGTDLIERVLTLMAETEPRVFWMASTNVSAWQLVQRTEPTAVAQVDRMHLGPLTVVSLREAVLVRHRRSGLPLHFEEPTEGRRLLRRRLARARSHRARMAILEADFFERLHRSTHGNVRLALFQWLRSADFEARDGELTVRPTPPLDFSFLAGLDLHQNFTLKAFLEHRTLTLDEHDAIFRIPRQESYQVFESLGNRHVIRPVADGPEERRVSEIEDDLRYEIAPLLVGAVNAHLSSQNIVH